MRFSYILLSAACTDHEMSQIEIPKRLPDYVIINDTTIPEAKRYQLRVPSQEVTFPLSREDLVILKILEAKHDLAKGSVTGLAAPQIGFNKRMIVFAVNDDPQIKKARPDFSQTMPKTIWINPIYKPLSDELRSDYETCISVMNLTGLVKRFTKISYAAYLPNGSYIQGEASGFLARIIQHEIDHINGVLFIDKAEKDSIIPSDEYREKYEAWEENATLRFDGSSDKKC